MGVEVTAASAQICFYLLFEHTSSPAEAREASPTAEKLSYLDPQRTARLGVPVHLGGAAIPCSNAHSNTVAAWPRIEQLPHVCQEADVSGDIFGLANCEMNGRRALSGGEIHWWNLARWERNSMVKEGLLRRGSPRGVWELSEKGRREVERAT